MRKNEQLIGAAAERKAIMRKLIGWMLKRRDRYDRARGGLGRKRKGV